MIVVYEYIWFMKGLGVRAKVTRGIIIEYIGSEKAVLLKEGFEEVRWALDAVSQEGISLSRFNDKVILAVAARKGLPLASYDSKLRRQATNLGLAVLPEAQLDAHRRVGKSISEVDRACIDRENYLTGKLERGAC